MRGSNSSDTDVEAAIALAQLLREQFTIYLATRPNVWLDTSALPFVYEVPRLAEIQRDLLRQAPEKVLFGTDVQPVPVGPEIQHIALTRHAREALYLALAGMVHDQLVDRESAVRIGRWVLRENARRLFGWDEE